MLNINSTTSGSTYIALLEFEMINAYYKKTKNNSQSNRYIDE